MSSNLGVLDRLVRIAIGVALIAYAIPVSFTPGELNWLGWIGVVPLVTGIFGFCPVYRLLGFSTCPLKRTA